MTQDMEGSVILIWGLCCLTSISKLWIKMEGNIIWCAVDTMQGEVTESVFQKV